MNVQEKNKEDKMKIGIIGSGHIGSILAKKLTALDHSVKIANSRGVESLRQTAQETGAVASTVEDAVKDVELVIIAIPTGAYLKLDPNLFNEVPDDVIIVDTSNYYPMWRDAEIPALDKIDLTESEWVQQQLGRPVFKAFNNIGYPSLPVLGKPKGEANRVALTVAGDNEKSKEVVMRLIDELGFDPVDAGSLKDSWKLQPGTPLYCRDLSAQEIEKELKDFGTERTQAIVDETISNRTAQENTLEDFFRKTN